MPGPVSKDIFHIVRQALLNSLKHANAYKVIISIIWNENRINFEIEYDGVGFEEDNISNVPQAGHFGLLNLKELDLKLLFTCCLQKFLNNVNVAKSTFRR